MIDEGHGRLHPDEVLFLEVFGCVARDFGGESRRHGEFSISARDGVFIFDPPSPTSGSPLVVAVLSSLASASSEDFMVLVDDMLKFCLKAGAICEKDELDWRSYGGEIIRAIISDFEVRMNELMVTSLRNSLLDQNLWFV